MIIKLSASELIDNMNILYSYSRKPLVNFSVTNGVLRIELLSSFSVVCLAQITSIEGSDFSSITVRMSKLYKLLNSKEDVELQIMEKSMLISQAGFLIPYTAEYEKPISLTVPIIDNPIDLKWMSRAMYCHSSFLKSLKYQGIVDFPSYFYNDKLYCITNQAAFIQKCPFYTMSAFNTTLNILSSAIRDKSAGDIQTAVDKNNLYLKLPNHVVRTAYDDLINYTDINTFNSYEVNQSHLIDTCIVGMYEKLKEFASIFDQRESYILSAGKDGISITWDTSYGSIELGSCVHAEVRMSFFMYQIQLIMSLFDSGEISLGYGGNYICLSNKEHTTTLFLSGIIL